MKHLTCLLATIAFAGPALADCDVDGIATALDAPLATLKPVEREVTDVQSTEGGVWRIYRERDGRLNSIVRIDGGESGMQETRLSVVNRKAYGIAATRVDYLHHAFIEGGPNGTAKRTTSYYNFCNGKVYVPSGDGVSVDAEQYPRDGMAARTLMLDDKDVADFTKGLTR
jgi:hypothetical protein